MKRFIIALFTISCVLLCACNKKVNKQQLIEEEIVDSSNIDTTVVAIDAVDAAATPEADDSESTYE